MSSWQDVSLRLLTSLRTHCHPQAGTLSASLPSALTTVSTAGMIGIAGLREVIAGLWAKLVPKDPNKRTAAPCDRNNHDCQYS